MRRVDLDEESYFNADDDEDDEDGVAPGPHPVPTPALPTLLPPSLARFQFNPKRRRQRMPGIPLRTGLAGATQRVPAPATPIHLPRTPPIGSLVDYGDDDEQSSDPDDALLESLVSSKPTSSAGAGTSISPMTASTAAATAAITITTTTSATTPTTATTATTISGPGATGGAGFVPLRAEKRRRAEDDEDEMGFERLVGNKTKRPAKKGAAGTGEEGPKRIRLRFGAASLAAASSTLPTAARSEPGVKDGDTG
jgi:protein phosphatase 4 regulatory subunit 3